MEKFAGVAFRNNRLASFLNENKPFTLN